jgi:apolipoprotein D and lipocalin family protein
MQFVWPIKADYRIVYLDSDYQYTVIGRNKRDYVWIMARNPEITEEMLTNLVQFVASIGYDINQLELASHKLPLSH